MIWIFREFQRSKALQAGLQQFFYWIIHIIQTDMQKTFGPLLDRSRHRENFWAFTGPRTHFGLILLISNMFIQKSFTGPTHLLLANVRGPVSFAVSAGGPKFLQDLIFFNIRIPMEGLPTGIFLTGQEDRHDKGFHWSSTVFTGRGPRTGGFPDVCTNIVYSHMHTST